MTHGLLIGRTPVTDAQPGEPVGVPLEAATRHLLICGMTGAGKSVLGTRAILSGHRHTDGLTIVIDPKGDLAEYVSRAYYAQYGTLDDLYYIDAMDGLPAISFFDVRPDVAAGRDRFTVVSNTIQHTLDLMESINPTEQRAIRAPRVLANLLRANYDPITGSDVFGISDLMTELYALRRHGNLPDVSGEIDEELLESHTDADDYMRDRILQGAVTRAELLYGDHLIRPLLDYTPDSPGDAFRIEPLLDQNAMLIIDLSDVHDRAQRVVAHVVLSLLWRAIRRARHAATDPATVLLFIDEVPQLRIGNRLADIVELGRGYGLGLGLLTQYPKQLHDPDAETNPYDTVLNNVQSIVAGRVPDDHRLAKRLAVGLTEEQVEQRLRTLPQSHVLAQIATPYGERTLPTQQLLNPRLPLGHPAATGDRAFTATEEDAYATARDDCIAETTRAHGIDPPDFTEAARADPDTSDAAFRAALQAVDYRSVLPVLDLPDGVTYDADADRIHCTICEASHPPTTNGYLEARRCHDAAEQSDHADVPPIELGLSIDESAIEDAPVSVRQLVALQFLYNLQDDAYPDTVIDRVHDPPLQLCSRVPITDADLDALAAADLITSDSIDDTRYPSVTSAGCALIAESPRREQQDRAAPRDQPSLLRRVLVEALARLIDHNYVNGSQSPVVSVATQYRPDSSPSSADEHAPPPCFDVVGLDDTGTVRVIGTACDSATPPEYVVTTYDHIAAVNPDDAIWAVPDDDAGHAAVIDPLKDPPETLFDTTPRLPAIDSDTRLKTLFGIDEPGFTDILTLASLRELVPSSCCR